MIRIGTVPLTILCVYSISFSTAHHSRGRQDCHTREYEMASEADARLGPTQIPGATYGTVEAARAHFQVQGHSRQEAACNLLILLRAP